MKQQIEKPVTMNLKLPPGIHRRAKAAAAMEGKTLTAFVIGRLTGETTEVRRHG